MPRKRTKKTDEPFGLVYLITNKSDGKKYIGQTIYSFEERWSRHCDKSSGCIYLYNAILKYGKDNFDRKILAKCDSIEEMNHREVYYIRLFNTLAPNGYNLDSGGKNKVPSNDTRKRMSEIQKKCKSDPSIIKKQSDSMKKVYRDNPNHAKKISLIVTQIFKDNLERRNNLAIKHGGKAFNAFQKLTGELVWSGVNQGECARFLKINRSGISSCLKLERGHVGGYIFRYPGEEHLVYNKRGNRRIISNIETSEIFKSIAEAAVKYKIATQGISRSVKSNGHYAAGGYHWRYV